MTEAQIQYAIEDRIIEKQTKRKTKLNSLQVELINLGMLIDQLERKLLYEKNSDWSEKLLNIRLVQLRKCYHNKLYQLRDHIDDKNNY